MFSRGSFGLAITILIFVVSNAQDMQECNKIVKALKCCRVPKGTENEELIGQSLLGEPKDIALKAQGCMQDFKELKATKPGEPSEYAECVYGCMLNGTKILNADFKFNQEVIIKIFENDPEYKEFMQKHLNICEEKTGKVPESAKCKSNFVAFTTCIVDQVANNCPKSSSKASDPECDIKNVSMEKCNILSMIP